MKKMDLEQMESVNGGIDWCYVSKGVTGLGGVLLIVGVPLSGGLAIAAYAAFATHAVYCELEAHSR